MNDVLKLPSLVAVTLLLLCTAVPAAAGDPSPLALTNTTVVSDTAGTDPVPEVRAAQAVMADAMAAADCHRVAGFFADGFTFYARGRHLESRETVVARCRQVPRPFPEMHHLVDEVRVLSGAMALALLVMEMHGSEPELVPRREVVTRLWIRGDDGRWRISHMHVSLDEVPDP